MTTGSTLACAWILAIASWAPDARSEEPVPAAPPDTLRPVRAATADPEEGLRGSSQEPAEPKELVKPKELGVPWWRRPGAVMARSALVPGWGQVTNRQYWKAGLVVGAEGYLIYRAVRAGERENDWEAAALADTTRAAEYEARAEHYNEERRKFTWWTAFAILLSMGDAYVDAVLGDIDAEFDAENRELRLGWRMSLD